MNRLLQMAAGAAGLAMVCAFTGTAAARPPDLSQNQPRFEEMRVLDAEARAKGLSSLSSGIQFDTTYYGGTVWAADSNRWEALRGTPGHPQRWTFSSGVGSNFTEPVRSPKPVGWHHRMEGWTGIDQTHKTDPWFRRATTCVLNGSYSMWAGVTLSEANALCYAGGQGYGNNWDLTVSKTLNYPGAGNVTLSYVYRTDCEPGFDYTYVTIDTSGTGAAPDLLLHQYTGVTGPATASVTLTQAGGTLRRYAGPITIKFHVLSDGAYSDEDGAYTTTCGHTAIDDIRLTGALADFSDFEAGPNGWALQVPVSGPGGDWSDIRALSTLPPALSFCPCSMADTVLVFADLTGGHSTPVDNFAASPWIDLKAGGDVGRPGRILLFDGYFALPLTNYIYTQALASWYPAVCPNNGKVYTHPFTPVPEFGFVGNPSGCTAPGVPQFKEMSGLIPPTAEQVRVGVGVLNYCGMFANCTGVTNATPYYDNIMFGVYGATNAPILLLRTMDVFQDNFAADGTLNPASPGRVDTNNVKGFSSPQPGSALGDTLIVSGDGGNTEVRVMFHVRPGPFTSASALSAWASAKWTNEPALGAGWYSARMDSAEQGGAKTAAKWMGALHELDPKFGGGTDTDRGAEGDASQLSHDIFPDKILTPGSRIDYFVQARYLPPDPRNPGGTYWFVTPDTTGGRYLEVEILPSSMGADTTWNCTLYVDHHADRDFQAQSIEEAGLTAVLGGGGNNREGTRFDRYDVQAPSSQQASLGRPLRTQYGATITQLFAYKAVAWHSGNLASFNLVDEDANQLAAWLALGTVGGNRFWGSGDGLARSMATEGEPTTIQFMNNYLGIRFSCDTIRLASCPTGSVLDSTFCLPLTNVAGAYFTSGLPLNARGNGCPNIRSFDLLGTQTAVPTAKGQLAYVKSDGIKNYAAVANYSTSPVDYKTVVDGVGVGNLRDPNGNTHNPGRCDIQTPALARATNVFSWFQAPNPFWLCKTPAGVSDADPGEGGPPPPSYRTRLGSISPNPMNPTTRISFSVGRGNDPTRLQVHDVTGRLVRTLVDARLEAGPHDVTWDGRDDLGRTMGSGMYFVRLAGAGVVESKKIVMAK